MTHLALCLQGSKTGVEYQPPADEAPAAAEQPAVGAADDDTQVQSTFGVDAAPIDETTAEAAQEETAELTAEFASNPGEEVGLKDNRALGLRFMVQGYRY